MLNIDPGVYAEEVEPTGVIAREVSQERYRLAAQVEASTDADSP